MSSQQRTTYTPCRIRINTKSRNPTIHHRVCNILSTPRSEVNISINAPSMRLSIEAVSLALSILPTALAIFADEAGLIDYHHELLGLPQSHSTFFHRPRHDDKATLIYTLSDLGVLGAVNPGNGKIVWRQFLGQNATDNGYLRPVDGENTVVSGIGNRIDSWDAMSGKTIWGNSFSGSVKDVLLEEDIKETGTPRNVLAVFEEDGKGLLRKLGGRSGNVIWEYKDGSSDLPFRLSANEREVFLVSLHGSIGSYNIKVTVLDTATGKKSTEYSLSTKSEITSAEDVLLIGSGSTAPIIAWSDKSYKTLKVHVFGKSSDLHSLNVPELDEGVTSIVVHASRPLYSKLQSRASLPHFLVHSKSATSHRADIYHMDLKSSSISKAYELPKLSGEGVFTASSDDAHVYFTRQTEDELVILSSASHGILSRSSLKLGLSHGLPIHATSEVVKRGEDSYAVRTAVVTGNDDWVLVRNGVESWTRVEGLAGVVFAEWAEIPESDSLVEALEAEAHSNVLSAYIHRVGRHIGELKYLPAYLQRLPQRILSSIIPSTATESKELTRDTFGFSQLLIVATQRGRVYALNSGNHGGIEWSIKAFDITNKEKWDVKGMWVENSKGSVTIHGSKGEYILIKIATGDVLKSAPPGSLIVQSTAVVETSSGQSLLPIGAGGILDDFSIEKMPQGIVVVQGKDGEISGLKYKIKGNKASPEITWSFQPSPGQTITSVISRPLHDPVASIGRVLGDRTVLYKYLNPNIILATAVSAESKSASFYLIDSVSGDVLYSTTHEGVDTEQPIASALTENWFAYSLWSDILPTSPTASSSKGYQLFVSELFESEVPNDRGPLGASNNVSSLQPSANPESGAALPYVLTASFVIPERISHMAVTATAQGITSRELICTLPDSQALVAIPRVLLDPRRPFGRDLTALEREEGLFPYSPNLEFEPRMVVTYSRDVLGIKRVITRPAILESTSLLFAYGIDIFGTRVTPSFAFDVLGSSFNKLSLVATVAALAVGVVVVAPMVSRDPRQKDEVYFY